jgi:hypothetical protein
MLRHVVWQCTDVSEVLTASIIRAITDLDDGGSKHIRNIGKPPPNYV